MNTERFKLTDIEIIENLDLEKERQYISFDESERLDTVDVGNLLEAQVNKVLSLLEPVELEGLSDEEIDQISWEDMRGQALQPRAKAVSQATVQKNQAKGQLYTIKER